MGGDIRFLSLLTMLATTENEDDNRETKKKRKRGRKVYEFVKY